ncbi:MAG: chemical-damaging agent resistance protein C [Fusobacteriia bacterium 4572_132]|nr:MAG: chemical-damaging agent resistance protein C [Fusobacteriia bacterium 4572_132]
MAVSLKKGQNVSLEKVAKGIKKLHIGLGWDTNKYDGGQDFDLDAMCLLVDENNKIAEGNEQNFVFYNNLKDPSEAVIHTGDNLTGEGEGDDEVLKVDLDKISEKVNKIIFIVNIHDAEARNQSFGQITNAFIRVLEDGTEKELIIYDLSEDYSIETGMVVGEIYRNKGEWKFKAVGSGYKEGLDIILREYAVPLA